MSTHIHTQAHEFITECMMYMRTEMVDEGASINFVVAWYVPAEASKTAVEVEKCFRTRVDRPGELTGFRCRSANLFFFIDAS